MSNKELNDMEKAILIALKKSKLGTDITGNFISIGVLKIKFGESRMPKVHEALESLKARDLIENVEGNEGLFRLTPFGEMQATRSNVSFNHFSNINNSNIASHSQNISQSINVSELPKDIKEKISELEAAIKDKDGSAMKKAFGYIAGKAVDVAIAIATGSLLR